VSQCASYTIFKLYHYIDDFDLDGTIDVGSTTRIDEPRREPIATVIQFFQRSNSRGEQYRTDYQKMYDDGIQIALKYLGE
jgi:succinate dehydrogenase/fumarate reductase flavoprotein subunit